MKNYLIIFKLYFFFVINCWLLYYISKKFELEKICITSDWLDYLMNFLEIENPTVIVQLLVIFCVFVIFSIMFLYIISKFNKLKIGMSVLLVFMSRILYKVQNNFLTLGQDINILGLTMEHVMSVKEKLTLLKDYIKNNNVIIDNQDFIVIWDAIKPLKKLDEVKEMIEQLVEALKHKELSTIEYMYSLLTVPNVMMTLTGVTIVGGLLYIGYWGYNKLNNKIESINNENTEDDNIIYKIEDAVLKEDLDKMKEENKNFMQERIDSVYDNFKEDLNKMKEENKNIIEESVTKLKKESMSRIDAMDVKLESVRSINKEFIEETNSKFKTSHKVYTSLFDNEQEIVDQSNIKFEFINKNLIKLTEKEGELFEEIKTVKEVTKKLTSNQEYILDKLAKMEHLLV